MNLKIGDNKILINYIPTQLHSKHDDWGGGGVVYFYIHVHRPLFNANVYFLVNMYSNINLNFSLT